MNISKLTVEEYNRTIASLVSDLTRFGNTSFPRWDPEEQRDKNRRDIKQFTDLLNSAIIYLGSGNFDPGQSASAVEVSLNRPPSDPRLAEYMEAESTDVLRLHLPYDLRYLRIAEIGSKPHGPQYENMRVDQQHHGSKPTNALVVDLTKPVAGDHSIMKYRPHSVLVPFSELKHVKLVDLIDREFAESVKGHGKFSTPGLSHLYNGDGRTTLANSAMTHSLDFNSFFQRALMDLLTQADGPQGYVQPFKGEYHFKKVHISGVGLSEGELAVQNSIHIPQSPLLDMIKVEQHSPDGRLTSDTLLSGPVLVERANGVADVMVFDRTPISLKKKHYDYLPEDEQHQLAATTGVAEYQHLDDPRVSSYSGKSAAREVYNAWRAALDKKRQRSSLD